MFRSRIILAGLLTLFVGIVPFAGGVPSAFASTLNVCPHCTYTTIQDALAHASDGDVITVAPGTYAGPISIDKSVKLAGAGAMATIIQGGGPVVTIGSSLITSEPTVRISGVTIRGGDNTTVPSTSKPWGGGVWIPPAAGSANGSGATVMLTNVVITGNTVQASASGDCGDGCTVSNSVGGGIGNYGTLTMTDSVVSNNQAIEDRLPSPTNVNASGGGIKSYGPLTLRNSTFTGNIVTLATSVVNQSGRFAAGGAISIRGVFTMDGSTVSNNTVSLTGTSTDPNSNLGGNGGGMIILDGGSGTIRDSVISGNSIAATAITGGNGDGGGGIDADSPLLLVDSTVSDNRATLSVTSPQPGSVNGSDGGGIENDSSATIRDSTIGDNSTTATGPFGTVFAFGGALNSGNGQTVTVADSTITRNTATATASSGTAVVQGGGINSNGSLTVHSIAVSKNSGNAIGLSGMVQGGGIANDNNGELFGPPPSPAPQLVLSDSTVTHNSVTGSNSNFTVQGGGVYNGTADGATTSAKDSVIAHNVPDQCFGC